MCLQIFVVPAVVGKVSPDRLSRVSGLRVAELRAPVKGALHFSRDGGCSCSMMSDDADFNAPVWNLEPAVLEGSASALRLLAEGGNGFSFQALWIGEEPESQSNVEVEDLQPDRVLTRRPSSAGNRPCRPPESSPVCSPSSSGIFLSE
jgi:hypothetical protein